MTEAQAAPVVSVCVITYNHAKFIRQCLESIVGQEVSWPWEIIIADDCFIWWNCNNVKLVNFMEFFSLC